VNVRAGELRDDLVQHLLQECEHTLIALQAATAAAAAAAAQHIAAHVKNKSAAAVWMEEAFAACGMINVRISILRRAYHKTPGICTMCDLVMVAK
jgi:hypothetical protein